MSEPSRIEKKPKSTAMDRTGWRPPYAADDGAPAAFAAEAARGLAAGRAAGVARAVRRAARSTDAAAATPALVAAAAAADRATQRRLWAAAAALLRHARAPVALDAAPLAAAARAVALPPNARAGAFRGADAAARHAAALRDLARRARRHFARADAAAAVAPPDVDAALRARAREAEARALLAAPLPAAHGAAAWRAAVVARWRAAPHGNYPDAAAVALLARAARDLRGAPLAGDAPFVYARALDRLGLALGDARVDRPGALGSASLLLADTRRSYGSLIAWSLATQDVDDSLALLEQLLAAAETFCHPSNAGPWDEPLAVFLLELTRQLARRLAAQDADLALRSAVRASVAPRLRAVAAHALYSRRSMLSAAGISAAVAMATLFPEDSLPALLKDVARAFDSVEHAHQLVAGLRLLSKLAHPLVAHVPAHELLRLLAAALPALDPNDAGKTRMALQFFLAVLLEVPLAAGSVESAEDSADAVLASRRSACLSRALLDWAEALLERLLLFVLGFDEPPGKDRSEDERVLRDLFAAVAAALFGQCADAELLARLLARLVRFVEHECGASLSTHLVTSLIAAAAARAPTAAWDALYPVVTRRLLSRDAKELRDVPAYQTAWFGGAVLPALLRRCRSAYIGALFAGGAADPLVLVELLLAAQARDGDGSEGGAEGKKDADAAHAALKALLLGLIDHEVLDALRSTNDDAAAALQDAPWRLWGRMYECAAVQLAWAAPGDAEYKAAYGVVDRQVERCAAVLTRHDLPTAAVAREAIDTLAELAGLPALLLGGRGAAWHRPSDFEMPYARPHGERANPRDHLNALAAAATSASARWTDGALGTPAVGRRLARLCGRLLAGGHVERLFQPTLPLPFVRVLSSELGDYGAPRMKYRVLRAMRARSFHAERMQLDEERGRRVIAESARPLLLRLVELALSQYAETRLAAAKALSAVFRAYPEDARPEVCGAMLAELRRDGADRARVLGAAEVLAQGPVVRWMCGRLDQFAELVSTLLGAGMHAGVVEQAAVFGLCAATLAAVDTPTPSPHSPDGGGAALAQLVATVTAPPAGTTQHWRYEVLSAAFVAVMVRDDLPDSALAAIARWALARLAADFEPVRVAARRVLSMALRVAKSRSGPTPLAGCAAPWERLLELAVVDHVDASAAGADETAGGAARSLSAAIAQAGLSIDPSALAQLARRYLGGGGGGGGFGRAGSRGSSLASLALSAGGDGSGFGDQAVALLQLTQGVRGRGNGLLVPGVFGVAGSRFSVDAAQAYKSLELVGVAAPAENLAPVTATGGAPAGETAARLAVCAELHAGRLRALRTAGGAEADTAWVAFAVALGAVERDAAEESFTDWLVAARFALRGQPGRTAALARSALARCTAGTAAVQLVRALVLVHTCLTEADADAAAAVAGEASSRAAALVAHASPAVRAAAGQLSALAVARAPAAAGGWAPLLRAAELASAADDAPVTSAARQTVLSGLKYVLRGGLVDAVADALPELLAVVYAMHSDASVEVVAQARSVAGMLAQLRLAALGPLLPVFEDAASSHSWRVRASVPLAVQLIAFERAFETGADVLQRTLSMLATLLGDAQGEVAEAAAAALASVVRSHSSAPAVRTQLDALRALDQPGRTAAARRALALGLAAYVTSEPYSVPPWLPPLLAYLARFWSDPDAAVRRAVRGAFAEFWRTHLDGWDEHVRAFDAAQLDAVRDCRDSRTYFS
jgi:hypothetical protein